MSPSDPFFRGGIYKKPAASIDRKKGEITPFMEVKKRVATFIFGHLKGILTPFITFLGTHLVQST